MKAVQVPLLLVSASIFLSVVSGIIRREDEKLIGEEGRRGAEKLEKPKTADQEKAGSATRGLWAVGQVEKGQLDGDYGGQGGYGVSGSDNLGYPIEASVGLHGFNNRPLQGGYYGHGQQGNGQGYPFDGAGLNSGHSGGGLGAYGHSGGGYDHGGGGAEYGHSGGGIGYGHGIDYGHSGGGVDCGHSGGTTGYGHKGGETGYYHGGGELFYGHSGGGVAHGYGGESYGGSGLSIFGKKLPLKKLLLPIAGLALLGAAAALTTHPVLLPLGTISGRKRRSITPEFPREIHPGNPFVEPIRW